MLLVKFYHSIIRLILHCSFCAFCTHIAMGAWELPPNLCLDLQKVLTNTILAAILRLVGACYFVIYFLHSCFYLQVHGAKWHFMYWQKLLTHSGCWVNLLCCCLCFQVVPLWSVCTASPLNVLRNSVTLSVNRQHVDKSVKRYSCTAPVNGICALNFVNMISLYRSTDQGWKKRRFF